MSFDHVQIALLHSSLDFAFFVVALGLGIVLFRRQSQAGTLVIVGSVIHLLCMFGCIFISEYIRNLRLLRLLNGPSANDDWVDLIYEQGSNLIFLIGWSCFLAAAFVGRPKPTADQS